VASTLRRRVILPSCRPSCSDLVDHRLRSIERQEVPGMLGPIVQDVQLAPGGLDSPVMGVVVCDSLDQTLWNRDDLVLGIGVGSAQGSLVAELAAAGAGGWWSGRITSTRGRAASGGPEVAFPDLGRGDRPRA
jgi:hypothetical protein